MDTTRFNGNLIVAGSLSAGSLTVPSATITDAMVAAAAGIAATKVEHQFAAHYSQADGSDVATAIYPLHTVVGATGEIVAVEAVCVDAPSGGDKKFTVDLQKASATNTTLASVLSAAIDYTNGTADYTVKPGTISSADLADGDTLVVVVTASGSTGAQGQGLVVTTTLREDPS
jgi:hypothetical protein